MSFQKKVESAEKVIRIVTRISNTLAMGVLVIMMLLTVADVLLRYAFRRPILGTVELTEYMMIPVVFLAIPWCAMKGAHAKIDLVIERLPPRVQAIFDSVSGLIGLFMISLICWQGLLESKNMWVSHIGADMLNVPTYPFYLIVGIGAFLFALVLLLYIIKNVERVLQK
jgi:TRAP-type C4-dicarboxylate transport system permease small subunit